MILDLTKSKSKIIFGPLPQDDPTQRQPDISLAKAQLNWAPKVDLEEGLKRTIKYFKKISSHQATKPQR
jgi:UDP-glucuronate decarboxylase